METIIIIDKVVNLLITIIASSYRNKVIIYLKIQTYRRNFIIIRLEDNSIYL